MTEFLKGRETEVDRWKDGETHWNKQATGLEEEKKIKSLRSHYGPGVDSASNRNEYQEHFLGVKEAGA